MYVLELEDSKFYIGVTNRFDRLHEHFNGFGSAWTQKHHPIRIVEMVYPGNSKLEKEKTLDYMRMKGWENVRGSGWTQVRMKSRPLDL